MSILWRPYCSASSKNSMLSLLDEAVVRENFEVADDGSTEEMEQATELSVSSATVNTCRVVLLC